MSKLRRPLRRVLRDVTPSPNEVQSMWSALQERRRPSPQRFRLAVGAFAVAMVAVIAFAGLRWYRAAGPLRFADGSELATMVGKSAAFDDGSRVELDARAVLEPLSNDKDAVELLLRSGRARFEVAPSARRWSIETGFATLQFSGARFAMWRGETGLEVTVYEGTIVLRGDAVPGRVRRIGANETIRVPEEAPRSTAAAKSSAPESTVTARTSAVPDVAPSITAKPSVAQPPRRRVVRSVPQAAAPPADWRALADQKNYDDAYRALGKEGVTDEGRRVQTMDDLLRLSDVARLSGHPSDAVPLLERASREFANDRRAGIAAFTRGRIHADDLHEPRHAAAAFSDAITLGLPDALAQTAWYRLVETRQQGGDRPAARDAARQYHDRYPHGDYGAAIDKLIETR